jgi:hypothetical protein
MRMLTNKHGWNNIRYSNDYRGVRIKHTTIPVYVMNRVGGLRRSSAGDLQKRV